MGYDLVVFEKRSCPVKLSEFTDWYGQTAASEDVLDISHTSDKLQNFFHSVRHIFPPMNGYSANPQMAEYLCDYKISDTMILLSLSYSVAEFASDIIMRAAYFAELGFFNPNTNGLPVLFDTPHSMLLEGEWFRPMQIDNFNSIKEKLNNMTAKNRSYLYVTNQIGNYIQIGGYDNSFTVEKRIYTTCTKYLHTKAGYSDTEASTREGYVTIAGNRVTVKQNQILSKAAAIQLFEDFWTDTATDTAIEWTDMKL